MHRDTEHGGGHHHGLFHRHHHHDHADTIDKRTELLALMKYMADHNASHAKELTDLAMQLNDAGEAEAYQRVMEAVKDYQAGNGKLSEVLALLNKEE